jgi:hypothetical protein
VSHRLGANPTRNSRSVASAREAEEVAQRLRELAAGLDELTAGRAG